MTDKLKGIEPGQRVRVTFEGVRLENSNPGFLLVLPDDAPAGYTNLIAPGAVAHPSFKIEPIEEPIKSQDRVRIRNTAGEGEVLHVDSQRAWVQFAVRSDIVHLNILERVK